MKLTKRQLQKLIKEELQKVLQKETADINLEPDPAVVDRVMAAKAKGAKEKAAAQAAAKARQESAANIDYKLVARKAKAIAVIAECIVQSASNIKCKRYAGRSVENVLGTLRWRVKKLNHLLKIESLDY